VTALVVVHGVMMLAAVVFITIEIRRSSMSALLAAIWGATFFLSSQFMFIYITGRLPAGLTTFAEQVHENRAK